MGVRGLCTGLSVQSGSVNQVRRALSKPFEGLSDYFNEVVEKKRFAANDVPAGRQYIEAYVRYIHYVERLYEAAAQTVRGHYTEAH
jgi:hypothetical protein